jgi:hypothetical protein
MTFNIAVQREQEQRIQADLVAVEVQIDKETDMYYHGEFDGATGGKPESELWSNLSYRSGWLTGVGQYYDKKYSSTFAEVF